MRIDLVAVFLIVVAFASHSAKGEVIGVFGQVTISARHQPTPQLPGFSTWTISASCNLPIHTFEFGPYPTGLFRDHGFHGLMNQVNPNGAPSVFQDTNAFFAWVGADPLQDSQFLVKSLDVSHTSGPASESGNILTAAFSKPGYFGTNIDFAQIVKPDNSIVTFLGRVAFGPFIPPQYAEVRGTLGIVPEPSIMLLVSLAVTATVLQRRR
jgi:hypothetical protein